MGENVCTYTGEREEAIVAYIYGEMTPSEHLAFAAHLEDCARCQSELSGFTAVRKQLASWAPPEMNHTLAQMPLTAPPIPPRSTPPQGTQTPTPSRDADDEPSR